MRHGLTVTVFWGGRAQDVMVVGEPSLMGGEFGDEDERLITRLENTQYDPTVSLEDPNGPGGGGGHPGGGGGPPPPNQQPPPFNAGPPGRFRAESARLFQRLFFSVHLSHLAILKT